MSTYIQMTKLIHMNFEKPFWYLEDNSHVEQLNQEDYAILKDTNIFYQAHHRKS